MTRDRCPPILSAAWRYALRQPRGRQGAGRKRQHFAILPAAQEEGM